MMPPTSIDGTDITGATIDGTDVTEITIDGQTVFTAGPSKPVASQNLVAWYPFRNSVNDVTAGNSTFGDTTDYSPIQTFGNISANDGVNDIFINDNPSDSYDSSNGGLNLGNEPIWSSGGGVSFTCWVFQTASRQFDYVYDHRVGNPGGSFIRLIDNNKFDVRFGSNTPHVANATTTFNSWFHIAAVRVDSTTANVYVDGQFDSSFTPGTNNGGNRMALGAPEDNLTVLSVQSRIDDARFYDTALSASQVNQIYQNTKP